MCLPAQSQEDGRYTGRWTITQGELDRAVELKQKELSQLSLSECEQNVLGYDCNPCSPRRERDTASVTTLWGSPQRSASEA